VRVTLAPHVPEGRATCASQFACYAITHQPAGDVDGIWGDMAVEYTAFRLPGAGTTVVWSWIFSGNTEHLDSLEEAVQGLSWPAP
jgi:hypothetical protein